MRYSRLKRRRTRQRYAAIFIILSLIVGIVCIASANTIGKYISDKIAPILNSFDKEDKGGNEGPKLSVPNNDDDNNEKKITETIKANPLVITAIQTGAFNDSNNAHNEASE